jgi:regulatory protein
MRANGRRRPRPPLDEASLEELALRYVARFATTRAKLEAYLARKLRERGWHEDGQPDLGGMTTRFAAQGFVDDAAFALSKSRSLTARGYGARRLEGTLRSSGVGEADGAAARDLARGTAVTAALRFAQRRRIGPFAEQPPDPKQRERAIAAMVRAGHSFQLARAVADLSAGTHADLEELAQTSGLAAD